MLLNRAKLVNALKNVDISSLTKKRDSNTQYNNKNCSYWNNLLWTKILEDQNIFGSSINKYEFHTFCGYYCSKEDCEKIFSNINQTSRSILFNEFENFLEKLYIEDYEKLMDCLEIQALNNEEKNKIEKNIFEESLNFEEYKSVILNGIVSPNDSRDWIYDNYLNKNKNINLPEILDFRNELLEVRNQGTQGSCFAMAVSCMKEWQEKRDYGLKQYLSPQFFYNIRGNLYDDISSNDEGMFGRNAMKLLKKVGICTEKIYPYGRIQYKDKISSYCFEEALNHKIKGYGRVLSIEALKYSLNYNGICIVIFPVYNYTPQLWIKNNDEKFLGGHAMNIVGYLEDCFIIRNSWGTNWGNNGYSYYYFKDWGAHWEIWTTIDETGSKKTKILHPVIEEDNKPPPIKRIPTPKPNPKPKSDPIPIVPKPVPIIVDNEQTPRAPSPTLSEINEELEYDPDLDDYVLPKPEPETNIIVNNVNNKILNFITNLVEKLKLFFS